MSLVSLIFMTSPHASTTEELIYQGRQFHQNNDLDNAFNCYQQVLSEVPNNSDALHLTGLIAFEWNRYQESLILFDKAIRLNPHNYQYYNDSGLVYEKMNLPIKALKSFKQALALEKNNASLHFNIANILFDQSQFDEAIHYYEKATSIQPSNLDFLYNLASAYAAGGRVEEAIMRLNEAIAVNPEFAEAHVNLGVIHQACGKLEKAVNQYRIAIQINPQLQEANLNLASVYQKLSEFDKAKDIYLRFAALLQKSSNFDQAVKVYETAISEFPDEFTFVYSLGTLYLSMQKYIEAEDLLLSARQIEPDNALNLNNLGLVYRYQERFENALQCFERAIHLEKDLYFTLFNLGELFSILNQPELAMQKYLGALEILPNYVPALNGIGMELQASGKIIEACGYYKQVLVIDENHAVANYNLACVQLANSEFKTGWKGYEWRIASKPGHLDYFPDPRTEGRLLPRPSSLMPINLQGKVFLLFNDQGISEELFFLRFVDKMKEAGAYCYYIPSDSIQNLLINCSEIDLVIDPKMIPSQLNYALGISELPLVLSVDKQSDIPLPFSLELCKNATFKVQALFAKISRNKPVLGVTWKTDGDNETIGKLNEQIDPYLLGLTLSRWNGNIVVLQNNATQEAMKAFYKGLGKIVPDISSLNTNLSELLVVMSLLDEYVGVCNYHVHLRESLGKSSKVMISHSPDWRWMLSGDKSPWFPNTQIYRQVGSNSWQQVMEKLHDDLSY